MSQKTEILKFIARTREETLTAMCNGTCTLTDPAYLLRHADRMINNVINHGWLNQAKQSLVSTYVYM